MPSSASMTTERPNWDLYAAAALLMVAFFQAMQWPLSPKFLDIYYHLSVMKGFSDAGGYVTHAFWEYAPGGRPHLYPPMLHVIMMAFYKLGVPAIDVGRLVDVSSYPLLLCAYWAMVRRLYSDRTAFIALLIFSSAYSVLLASTTLSAFNLSMIVWLIMIIKVYEKRYVQAGLLLGIAFYTHTYAAGLSVLFLALYGLGRKDERKGLLVSAVTGVGMAAPFLAYQFLHKDHFTLVSRQLKESNLLEIDILLYALALCGLWQLRHKPFFKRAWLPLCLWAAFVPMLATHPVRFTFGHGLMGLALLGTLSLEKLTEKKIWLLWTALILALFMSPVFHWNFEAKQGGLRWADRTLLRYLLPDPHQATRSNGFTIFFEEPYQEMKGIIQANSEKNDVLWTDFSYTAGILAVISDRVTSCAMLAEIKPYQESSRLKDAKIIVWFKDSGLRARAGMQEAVKRYDLRLLKEVEMAYIFINPDPAQRAEMPKPLVPTLVLFLIVAAILVAGLTPRIRQDQRL